MPLGTIAIVVVNDVAKELDATLLAHPNHIALYYTYPITVEHDMTFNVTSAIDALCACAVTLITEYALDRSDYTSAVQRLQSATDDL